MFLIWFLLRIFLFVSTVGEPIAVERNPSPTTDEIDALHQKYVKALVALFDEHKTKFGVDEKQVLKII